MMYCIPFKCEMQKTYCQDCIETANNAIDIILSEGKSMFQLADWQVLRMIVCSKCRKSGIPVARGREAFRKSVSVLAEEISKCEAWDCEEDVQNIGGIEYESNN